MVIKLWAQRAGITDAKLKRLAGRKSADCKKVADLRFNKGGLISRENFGAAWGGIFQPS